METILVKSCTRTHNFIIRELVLLPVLEMVVNRNTPPQKPKRLKFLKSK